MNWKARRHKGGATAPRGSHGEKPEHDLRGGRRFCDLGGMGVRSDEDARFFLKVSSAVRKDGTRPEGEGEELATVRGGIQYGHEPAKTRNSTSP